MHAQVLRLRRADPQLALTLRFVLPSLRLYEVGAREHDVYVWNLATGQRKILSNPGQRFSAVSLAFVDEDTLLSSGGISGRNKEGRYETVSSVCSWSTSEGKRTHTFTIPQTKLLGESAAEQLSTQTKPCMQRSRRLRTGA